MQVAQSTENMKSNTAFSEKKLMNVVLNKKLTVLMAVPKNVCAESKTFQVYLRHPFQEKFSILYRMQFY